MTDKIVKVVIEALTARGFAEPEARQMLRRIQTGEEVPGDARALSSLQEAYNRGFEDGGRSVMRQAAEQRAREAQESAYARAQRQAFGQYRNVWTKL